MTPRARSHALAGSVTLPRIPTTEAAQWLWLAENATQEIVARLVAQPAELRAAQQQWLDTVTGLAIALIQRGPARAGTPRARALYSAMHHLILPSSRIAVPGDVFASWIAEDAKGGHGGWRRMPDAMWAHPAVPAEAQQQYLLRQARLEQLGMQVWHELRPFTQPPRPEVWAHRDLLGYWVRRIASSKDYRRRADRQQLLEILRVVPEPVVFAVLADILGADHPDRPEDPVAIRLLQPCFSRLAQTQDRAMLRAMLGHENRYWRELAIGRLGTLEDRGTGREPQGPGESRDRETSGPLGRMSRS